MRADRGPVLVLLTALLTALLAALAARPAGADAAQPAAGWVWPMPLPHRVVHAFAPPAQPWLPGHRGVDLAGRAGERVLAAGAGVVTFAGAVAGVGVVSVASGALRTTYQPVIPRVRRGAVVRAGSLLGWLTRRGSHCAPAVCLHWGLLRAATYLDPLVLLGLGRPRLLPIVGPSGVRLPSLATATSAIATTALPTTSLATLLLLRYKRRRWSRLCLEVSHAAGAHRPVLRRARPAVEAGVRHRRRDGPADGRDPP